MESKKSTNFDFILKTSVESYYDLLKNAERAWETHESLTYIALRMVVEDLSIKLEEKYEINKEKESNFKSNLENLKEYVPSFIIEHCEYIRVKCEKGASEKLCSDLEESGTLLALKKVHEILIWYLKNITKEVIPTANYSFITPESIKEKECDLAIDKKVLENKEKFIISLEKQIKTNRNDEKKQGELEELLKSVKKEKTYLIEKLEKKEIELKEVLNNFKELQFKFMSYTEKDKSYEENSKYPDFYKGFLSLQGYELRVVYAFLKSLNLGSIFLNKSKGMFLKSKRGEFLDFVEREVEDLKKYSDGTLKLKLYHVLLKLTNTPVSKIEDKKTFNKSLDSIVDKAYFIIENRDGFNGKVDKLEAIVNYYLILIMDRLSYEISHDKDVEDKTSYVIFEVLNKMPEDEKKDMLSRMNFTDTSYETIKENININKFEFLKAALDCGMDEGFEFVLKSIFSIYVSSQKDYDFCEFRTRHDMLRVYIGPLLLLILLKEFKISRENLVPIFVMEISISNKILRKEGKEKLYYNQLVKAWLEEKEKYDKVLSEKHNLEKNLKEVKKAREVLLTNERKFVAEKDNTENAIKSQWNIFNEKVLKSEKIKSFSSYEDYISAVKQRNLMEVSQRHNRRGIGIIKNLFSLDNWKSRINKLELSKNIKILEENLIKEARNSKVFEKELLTIRELEEILKDKESGLEDIRVDLKENSNENEKLNKLISNSNKLVEKFKEDNFNFAK